MTAVPEFGAKRNRSFGLVMDGRRGCSPARLSYVDPARIAQGIGGDGVNGLPGPLDMPQLFLFCALDVERHLPEFDRRMGRPGPVASHARVRRCRPSRARRHWRRAILPKNRLRRYRAASKGEVVRCTGGAKPEDGDAESDTVP